MNIIVDYGMGNLGSIQNMLKRIGQKAIITSDIEVIKQARRIILPGVGSFDTGIEQLNKLNLIPVLCEKAFTDKVPIMGICLGLQLMTRKSNEGILEGLNWFDSETVSFRFNSENENLVLPNMGWRKVKIEKEIPLFDGMKDDLWFYFVHNYHLVVNKYEDVAMTSHYGYDFVVSVARDNILGVQFHPEKSHKFGLSIFSNFINNY